MEEILMKLIEVLSAPAIVGSICLLVVTGVNAVKGCLEIQQFFSDDTDSKRIKEIHDEIIKGSDK